MNHNLFTALRAAFPKDLDAIAVESVISADSSLNYSWRDLDRATAMMANLLKSLRNSSFPISFLISFLF